MSKYLRLYTGGTFDLFHSGHVNFLYKCSLLAQEVIVSLNTDEFIKEYKKSSPIYSYKERQALLKACKHVSRVVPNTGGKDSKPSILATKPNIIAIGSDWAKRDYYKQMQFTQEWLDEQKISLVYIPYTEGVSSTSIKNRILNENQES